MPSVDNRVVEMRFDNKDFETDVSESISSLDKLKKALNFKNAADGMDEIEKSTDTMSVKMSALATFTDQWVRNLTNQVYNLQTKFVGLIKSLSIDQVTEGWSKYGTKTAAVQTVMAATANQIEDEGERMKFVNEQLDRLNWFADETSASLMDMTNNIGKFTNNGVELKTAVTSMQGIANWGYLSGANINEMSRAMYNLSQALSVGAVTLIDWKSIENANMATVEFKQTALDTAVAVGTLTKVSEGLYKTMEGHEVTLTSFNRYLTTDKWFTKDVLTKTLNQYGDFTNALADEMNKLWDEMDSEITTSKFLEYIDKYLDGSLDIEEAVNRTGLSTEELISDLKRLGKEEYALGRKAFKAAQEAKTFTEAIDATKDAVSSKWMQTYEIIFGDYKNAKNLWTRLSNELWEIFAAGGDARNTMLKKWAESTTGGYKQLWDGIWNLWDGLKEFGSGIKTVWKSIFPGLDAEKLIALTEKFYNFSNKFKNKFVSFSESIKNVADVVGLGIGKIKENLNDFFNNDTTEEVVDNIDSVSESVDNYILKLAKTLPVLDLLVSEVFGGKYGNNPERRATLEAEGYSFELIQNAVNEAAGSLFRYKIAEEDLAEAQRLVDDGLIDQFNTLKDTEKETNDVTKEVKKAHNWLSNLRDVIGGVKSAFDLLVEGGKLAIRYLAVPVWEFLVKVFKKVLDVIAPFSVAFSNFVNKLKESKAITKSIKLLIEWFRQLKENLKNQENIQKFIGYFQELKNKVDGIKESSLEKITNFFDKLVHLDENLKLPKVSAVGNWINNLVGNFNKFIGKFEKIKGFWPKIKEFFNTLDFSGIKGFGTALGLGISGFLESIFKDNELKNLGKEWFSGIWEGFIEKIKLIDWNEVLNLVSGIIKVSILTKLGFGLANFFNAFGNIRKGTLNLFESFGEILHNFASTLKATTFLGIAIGIGILTASIIALSKLTDTETLAKVVVYMSVLILAISVLMKVIMSNKSSLDPHNIANITVQLPRLGIALIGFALAISSLFLAVKVLSKIKSGKMWEIFGFIAAFLVLMSSLIIALDKLDIDRKRVLSIAGAFTIFAIGLGILTIAILELAGAFGVAYALGNGIAVWSAVGAIMAIMLSFGGMLLMANKSDNAIKIATAFLIFSASILVLTPALIALMAAVGNENPWSKILAVVASIVSILAAFTVALAVLNTIGTKQGGFDKGLKAMLAMAVGVVAIGAVLLALKGTKWDDIKDSVKGILTVLGVLLLIAGVLGAIIAITGVGTLITDIMESIAFTIALLGVGALTAGVGILAFAKALQILSDSSVDAKKTGKNLAEGIVAFFDELVENGGSIIKFIVMLLSAILGAIILFKSKAISKGSDIINALCDSVIDSLGARRFALVAAVLLIIGTIMQALNISMPDITTYLMYMIANIINSLAYAAQNSGGVIGQAINNLVGGLLIGIGDALNEMLGIDDLNKSWQEFIRNHPVIGRGLYGDISDEDIDNLPNPIIDAFTAYDKFVFGIEDTDVKDANLSNINATQKEIEEGLDTYGSNVVDSINGFKDKGEQAVNAAKTYQDPYSVLLEKILTARNHLMIGDKLLHKSELEQVQKDLENIIGDEQAIRNYLDINFPEYFAQSISNGFSSGISSSGISGTVSDYLKGMYNWDGTELLDDSYDFSNLLGQNTALGFVSGLTSEEETYVKAFQDYIGEGQDVWTSGWLVNSPSKFTRDIGKNVVLGFIEGINQYSKRSYILINSWIMSLKSIISSKASQISNTFYESLNQVLRSDFNKNRKLEFTINDIIARITNAINNNLELNPVIRPVLDLSDLQIGKARIGSMLGTSGYSFNPNLTYSINGANNIVTMADNLSLRNDIINEKIIDLQKNITQINSDNHIIMTTLGRYLPYIPEVANMQVTLDKKTLVGELTPAIDTKLGANVNRRR